MSENLNGIQIQLLLYFLEAEPKKRTVTDAARYLNKPKSTLTHILDSLDDLALMERVEGRKSVLTAAGERTAQQLLHQRKILEQYMQYQDIPPAQIKENALRALSAGFSDEFMERLAEQEGRMRLKEIFAGHRDFHGGDICNYLKDGSYYFPFIIYREQIKNHNNLSMANRGFENPCEMIVKDHDVFQIPHFQETPRISINTASIEQLTQLPGVGQATAEKIVAYRAEHGLFQTLEDLMQVPGIKQKKWEALKEFICL